MNSLLSFEINRRPSHDQKEVTMKRTFLSLPLCVVVGCLLSVSAVFAQDDFTKQDESSSAPHTLTLATQDETLDQVVQDGLAGQTLPLWSYAVVSRIDGGRYQGAIVGRPPGTWGPNAAGITYVPTYIVPLVIRIGNTTFDPTAADPCLGGRTAIDVVQKSPLFRNSGPYVWGNPAVNVGTTQYIDAQLRGEFWNKYVAASVAPWHTDFALTTLGKLSVGTWPGRTANGNGCGKVGLVSFYTMDNYIRRVILPLLRSYGIGTTTLPIILTSNVYTTTGGNSIIGGYHNAIGAPMQAYGESVFDGNTGTFNWSQDISILSHELGEAVNDPSGRNGTPAWGHIGQVSGCQNNFEVGDPLTGTNYPAINLNGFNYHPQELAFFSWFMRPQVNWGLNGWYSSNGTFVNDAGAVCR